MCSSRSLALDRPRHTALRYPAVLSNRANTYRLRRQPAPIHAPFRSRTTSAIAPPTVSHGARGTQIPITHAAPPTCPFPRFPPLEVCGRRPSETAALSLIGPASENLHKSRPQAASNRRPLLSQQRTLTGWSGNAPECRQRKCRKPTPAYLCRAMENSLGIGFLAGLVSFTRTNTRPACPRYAADECPSA